MTKTAMSNSRPTLNARIRIDLAPGLSVGPGKIALLEAIAATGSLSAAARQIKMSYRRAWLLVDSLNGSLAEPVTTASVGGRGGGGVALTPAGQELVASYREFEAATQKLAVRRFRGIGVRRGPAQAAGHMPRGVTGSRRSGAKRP